MEKFHISSLRPFTQKSVTKAVSQMITSFLPFLAIWWLSFTTWEISKLLSVALMIINAFFLVRIFIIQHDCGHHSYFDPKSMGRWNTRVGWFASLFHTLPYSYWRGVHHHHHMHTGQLEERDIGDLDFMTVEEYRHASRLKRIGYRIFRYPVTLFIIAPAFYFLVSNRWSFVKINEITKKVKIEQTINNLLILIVYGSFYWAIGSKFLVIQGLTIFFFSIIAFWFFYVQHAHEFSYQRWREKEEWEFVDAALEGASRYDLPKVFHWLTGNIGYHHLHHLNPAIASYRLTEADQMTLPLLKDTIKNLSFIESLRCIFNKLWDEEQKKFISFAEFRRREKK
ncbi:MAG: hypothetical protein RL023_704 [Candidatus Parcubacteria bacterium]|jgi:omega-6 fatty acid desaturase (delta-12 desaturase)